MLRRCSPLFRRLTQAAFGQCKATVILAPIVFFSASLRVGALLMVLAPLARADSTPVPIPAAASPATLFAAGNTAQATGDAGVHLSQAQVGAESGPSWARFASGKGTALFLGAGVLLPLAEDGRDRNQHALRAADTLLTSGLVTEALKKLIHEERPDGSDHESFPSEHATAAFAIASMQAHFHPNQAIFWYLGATAISASRVKLHRHYTHDVVAGAAIGILTTELEYRQQRGLLLFPFIHGGGASRQPQVAGLSFGGSF